MAPPAARGRDDGEDDVRAAVARGEIDPIYCLSGERFLVDATHAAIRAAVLGAIGAAAGFNHDTFELKETGLGPCLATAQTLPMMAKKRLVVGKGVDLLKADSLEPLVEYAADPNPATCLVLVAAEKVDVRFKAFAALRKAGYLHVFAPLRDNALAGWLRTEARARKIDLQGDAAVALADLAGPDMGPLSQALDQLALYVGEGRAITVDDVEALVAETRQRHVFELSKAIGAGDVPRSLGLLANMLRNREAPLKIQFMLARQMRQIWRAKELLAAGAARGEIAAAVGMNPYFLDDVLGPARRMSRVALARAFERLYQSDQALKSSRVDGDLIVSRLVQSLAEDAGARAR
ncbi:MAG TPA: DNA polymerase III subunit delta [Polyangia bacterium]|nr:DNA polymerase III subunit delta [Polyangia bacterium]